MAIVKVSYRHPLEEGLGQLMKMQIFVIHFTVSYRHPLEEGLGPRESTGRKSLITIVSYRHPLEEGLGLLSVLSLHRMYRLSVTVIH